MNETIYRELAEHLDQLPGGFAPSETGAEIPLLQRLFTPEQAELAILLTLDPENAAAIAQKANLSADETQKRLEEMAQRGLIFAIYPDEGPTLYKAVPFVVGIYEFQVNRLSPELRQDLSDYWRTQKPRERKPAIPQMRTIPVEQGIETRLQALPYEQATQLVEEQDRFAVAPCICRQHAKLVGGGCDAPEETCLMFGEWADFYVKGGMGRSIDKDEVLEILAKADVANLVLQPTNSQHASAMCCCCGCCCGILNGYKRHPKPAEAVASAFIAAFDADLCTGCWTCLDRCQMEALTENGDHVAFNADRCIGCGLCVSTCPGGALTLERKPQSAETEIPETFNDTWVTITRMQAEE
ncbi:MAG: 4Fe-4S binding protein [Anaerolineae bacterium]|nr:4Fe-4S binding protein [Anaerolineae bacterium]